MEYEQKVTWLRRYLDSQKVERELAQELEQLRSQAERITPVLSATPGGGGNGQQLPAIVERIEEIRSKITERIEQGLKARTEIEVVINQLTDAQELAIMRRRYLLGQRWGEIAQEMNLDKSWVTRLHRRAVRKLEVKGNSEMRT